ncbi:3476_t:CDS:2 [Scutellospora calospora]|uniref:3476_t:CDS:1 n=1 Tax=Scutellospora calospora TaxID=85575 RepID=A0ACA9KE00_9GLOM|nr:3476_t:CDS:2 [Scutellospora calospora]
MSLPPWFVDDASCGTSNPISGLMKQFVQDKSLQRDRFGYDQINEGSSKRTFRTRSELDIHEHEYEKFFNQPDREPGVYDLNQMDRELQTIMHNTQNNEKWVHDFLNQPNLLNNDLLNQNVEFEKIFNNTNVQDEWINKYLSTDQIPSKLHPDEYTAFEKAFNDVNKNVNWESEFNAQEEKLWANEFKQQNDNELNNTNAKAELSKTAGKLIESVKDETNPKFKNSSFMKFMKQLRDNEVSIEGNKVVEQKSPVSNGDIEEDWGELQKDYDNYEPYSMGYKLAVSE